MDISDILRDLNPPHHDDLSLSDATSEASHGGEADLQALTRAWINERGTTELLAWPPDELIARCQARIQTQIGLVERLTGDPDPQRNLTLIIIQTDLERWKYLVRAYLRTRLAKLARCPLYHVATPGRRARLAPPEAAFAMRHHQLRHAHYGACFLAGFPVALQRLDDAIGGLDMLDAPDADAAVVVRGRGRLDGADSVSVRGRGRDGEGEVRVARGEVVVAKWADVRASVESGELELV